MSFKWIMCLVLVVGGQSMLRGAVGSFEGLGDLPGGNFLSIAHGVSSDGLTVVGCGTPTEGIQEAFRWTRDSGMVGLGDLPGGDLRSIAYAVSADGSVVAGEGESESCPQAFRWQDGAGPMVALPLLTATAGSSARAVSADGSVVVGTDYGAGRWDTAFQWTAEAGMTGLGEPTFGCAVSADGTVAGGGVAWAGRWGNAWRWTASLGLAFAPVYGWVDGASADGSVLVGCGMHAGELPDFADWEAFRWTGDGSFSWLGYLPFSGSIQHSAATAVSADGSIIVGWSETDSGHEAFLWDPHHGMRSLRDVLIADCALDLTGWWLTAATGVSADGRTVVGYGTNPDRVTEAWLAVIPEPATLSFLALGGLAVLRRRRR